MLDLPEGFDGGDPVGFPGPGGERSDAWNRFDGGDPAQPLQDFSLGLAIGARQQIEQVAPGP